MAWHDLMAAPIQTSNFGEFSPAVNGRKRFRRKDKMYNNKSLEQRQSHVIEQSKFDIHIPGMKKLKHQAANFQ